MGRLVKDENLFVVVLEAPALVDGTKDLGQVTLDLGKGWKGLSEIPGMFNLKVSEYRVI